MIKNPFKRKRCPQCGEVIRMFKKVNYCTLDCKYTYEKIKKEGEVKNGAQ